jgi:hypothetical protein
MATYSETNTNKNKNDFKKIVIDFCLDLNTTFPELKSQLDNILIDVETENGLLKLYEYCKTVYPERFFDILYKNESIFLNDDSNTDDEADESTDDEECENADDVKVSDINEENDNSENSNKKEKNTYLLPNINFRSLWRLNDISDKTRETMWNYLQLILFTVITDIKDSNSFGDTAKLFEAISQDEFRVKLEETFENMKNVFEPTDNTTENNNESPKFDFNNIPNVNDMHEHINGMMGGKLGQLAKEIAEETASELNMDMTNVNSVNDVFNKMFKNPTKLMGLVKSVGDKLDDKIKSGDIKESDLIKEATDIIKRMKDMPGMENIQTMLSKLGIPGMSNLGGKNTKVNFSEMENQLNRNMKKAKMKERMKGKIEERTSSNNFSNTNSLSKEQQENEARLIKVLNSGSNDEIENFIFSSGEKVEKSKAKSKNINNSNKHKSKNK